MTQSSVIVIGAGAWGLPAALQLQDRGWAVTLLERFEIGSPFASSGGSTRLWRLADPQRWRSQALSKTVYAMDRLGDRIGEPVYTRTGLLWRDTESLPNIADALGSIGQRFDHVSSEHVGDFFDGLRPDGRDALFVEEAGVVRVDTLLAASLREFTRAGGTYQPNARVLEIEPSENSARITLEGGLVLEADQVLIAAGPGTREILTGLNIGVPLKPYIEQVVFLGDATQEHPTPTLPAFVDCPTDTTPGIYAMPNGTAGYKVGLDTPLRALRDGTLGDDLDRTEDAQRTETIRARIHRDIRSIVPNVLATQVCTWTDSGDGDFIIGRTHPSVVLACGDSGEGFKFSAFMGEYLADLVEGGTGNPEWQQHWNPQRFQNRSAPRDHFDAIGRH
jgi:sarcosine oxidase